MPPDISEPMERISTIMMVPLMLGRVMDQMHRSRDAPSTLADSYWL